ncbi:ABC-type dipeptide/oligopeptide/nickel transport system, permease components [Hahella chejuensis KCTC 2396]|uniref:ABC-type dipeptide/oligopeptide/nickel transport system, permease components n=1 Tax=Hahella chejuensis (strain KCTC 2396) TaxID=349521 RepID=Q2S753_HAHCH|nr:ABC transporter permease [Hahella chejuensis]ABC33521.1 ABC-type dipeptide/oligopeptide/nickel transport system, permease components [Hahella chejuensis KCTC 2396]
MRFILRRLGFYCAAFAVALTLNFFIPRLMPGDPASTLFVSLRGRMSQQSLDAMRAAYGFDGSLWDQFVAYVIRLLHGDLGVSTVNFPQPASEMLLYAAGWTLFLVGVATLLSFAVGILFGMFAAWRRGSFFDTLFTPVNVMLNAFTPAVVALLLLYGFALQLQWFPLGRAYDIDLEPGLNMVFMGSVLYHSVLPLASLVIIAIGGWHLSMRNTMINLLNEDYITLARAKGLSGRRILFRYAARNAMLPQITSLALTFGFVLGGALITEVVFNYPGLGKFTLAAIEKRDYAFIQGQLLFLTVTVLLANLIADLLNLLLDPRLRDRSELA